MRILYAFFFVPLCLRATKTSFRSAAPNCEEDVAQSHEGTKIEQFIAV
jgi:prolyl oligopeptidase PreP (S9A serine peptidase family)